MTGCFKFKVGDRVIDKVDSNAIYIITKMDKSIPLYFIEKVVSDGENQFIGWVVESQIELDKQWYREEKLKNILKDGI